MLKWQTDVQQEERREEENEEEERQDSQLLQVIHIQADFLVLQGERRNLLESRHQPGRKEKRQSYFQTSSLPRILS